MHVVLVSPGVTPPARYGGTERVVAWLGRELAALGQRVTLLAPPGSSAPWAGAVASFEPPAGNINATPLDLDGLIPADADLVHFHFAQPVSPDLPVLKTVHGYPFHFTGREAWAEPGEFGPEYSFVSDAHRRACGRPDLPFVHNGIALDEYEYREDKEDWLLFLGKLDWNVKGLPLALRLAREEGLRLVLAGDFLDPAFYARELKPLLGPKLAYAGPVGGEQKADLLARARALVFPTLWPEPFGLVAVEALASGTPVLTTGNGALPEIMVQGVTGFMGRSLQETRQQLRLLDSIDPAACRARAEERFTARRMAGDYLRLYAQRVREFAQTRRSPSSPKTA